ncbi:L-type lectin-domain containing receptor kinase IX.1-like [Miscanthus floridulus]|uniref:L-type lectin-domain containing receptor kinase IX.1-like n=1 Tax=Miscanthus floridulus TaxID=154761 RepID=UPI003457DBD7
MACESASAPLCSLAFICLSYSFLVLCMHVPSSSSVSFSFNFSNTTGDDPCGGLELMCYRDAHFDKTTSAIELTKDLRGEITDSQGRVWYKLPVPLWKESTGEVASFTTTFSFNLTPSDSNRCMDTWASQMGDGMAFFLAPWPNSNSSTGGGIVLPNATATEGGDLYLFNPSNHFNATGDNRVVAVEFDTFYNDRWDNSTIQHIGIDVNSIVSVASTDTPGMNNLTSPFTKAAMISYDNVTKMLAIDLQINGTPYALNTTVNLTQSLPEIVAVGFSASTGDCVELHQLLSWSFNSTLQEPKLAEVAGAVIKPEPSAKLLLEVLVPTGSVLVCAGAVLLLWRTHARNRRPRQGSDSEESDEQNNGEAATFEMSVAGPRRYYYRDLAAATGGFADENLLGRGGFGSVYQGRLPGSSNEDDNEDQQQQLQLQRRRQEVAIKKFNSESSSQSRKEFEAEVKIIARLRHRNLVQLLGWCDSRRGLLLVYELMPEGSLDKHIYSTDKVLNWPERYKIILGLGSALHYLHRDWDQRVVHGDIKPSNILLDSSYNAKLGDFGLARLGDHGTGPQTTDLVKGTMGYIDPEFVNTHRRSTESDIYSFGVVLLEIVSGRSPVDRQDPSFSLLKWVETLYCQQGVGRVLDAADVRLRGDEAHDRQMERALLVGLWCAHRDPGQRPSIAEAMQVLQSEELKLPALSLHMYSKLATPPSVGNVASTVVDDSGVSGSSFASGVRSAETAGTTAGSSESFATLPVVLPPHSTW